MILNINVNILFLESRCVSMSPPEYENFLHFLILKVSSHSATFEIILQVFTIIYRVLFCYCQIRFVLKHCKVSNYCEYDFSLYVYICMSIEIIISCEEYNFSTYHNYRKQKINNKYYNLVCEAIYDFEI